MTDKRQKRPFATVMTTAMVVVPLLLALGLGLVGLWTRSPEAPQLGLSRPSVGETGSSPSPHGKELTEGDMLAGLPPGHGPVGQGSQGGGFFHPPATSSSADSNHSALYRKVLQAYELRQFQQGASLLAGHWAEVSAEAEGCELLISVHAGLGDMPQLEEAARFCLGQDRGRGIAEEGLAYSMSSQGKFSEALELLSAERKRYHDARTDIALARLHVMLGQDEKAGQLFMGVIESSSSWSLWLGEALKQRQLVGNPDFVRRLVALVLTKQQVVASIEKRLLELTQGHGLKEEEQLLQQRLSKVAAHESA